MSCASEGEIGSAVARTRAVLYLAVRNLEEFRSPGHRDPQPGWKEALHPITIYFDGRIRPFTSCLSAMPALDCDLRRQDLRHI